MPPQISFYAHNRNWSRSLIVQTILCVTFGALAPSALYFLGDLHQLFGNRPALITLLASAISIAGGIVFTSKVNQCPGVRQLGSVVPGFCFAYGIVALIILAARLEYSVSLLLINLLCSSAVYVLLVVHAVRADKSRYYTVPGGKVTRLKEFGIASTPLSEPALPAPERSIIVADLHRDMEHYWERMLAEAAIRGIPVFHYKQLYEAATGKVRIEHLSENSFGALIPNMSYIRMKRVVDTCIAILAVPFLIIPFLVVSVLIKIDSPGPVLFFQERFGYKGKIFRVVKFRTMMSSTDITITSEDLRLSSMTSENDPRITRVGSFLRRTRIDELPQIFNIIAGQMSWIGPRPEALNLSRWYEREIPFYSYRHIVRPGVTGWAQVNQGHVTDLVEIGEKLQYDFYYIKYFSGWLDVLIFLRTFKVVFMGIGAK